tara:strand:+ start:53 stop:961 length:909 start_codon:yes stop_codon:yes gene_type:complete
MIGLNRIVIPPALLRQICDIDEFKGLWGGLERHTTGLQLLGDVADYGATFKQVLGALQERDISLEILKAIHASQIKGEGMVAGFKSEDAPLALIGHDGVVGTLETTLPEDVEPLLEKLCSWVNAALKSDDALLHPLIVIAVFSAVFLQIAPFGKGNQIVLRFLIVLMMLKAGYLYAPYVSLEPIMRNQAENLYEALVHNQQSLEAGAPEWAGWLEAFMAMLQAQKDELYTRLYDKEDDLKNLPRLSARIMALFKEHKRLQMKEIIKLTNGRRATIKLRLNELVNTGYLKRHGKARSTWYSLD